jgi:hypothetical protein
MIQQSSSLYEKSPTMFSFTCILPKAVCNFFFFFLFLFLSVTLYNNVLQDLNRTGDTVSGALQELLEEK